LDLIGAVAPAKDGAIVDIGGGASLLVDCLLGRGYNHVTVVDVSEAALGVARARLGTQGDAVTWVAADARYVRLPTQVDLWHDRAVFHFLTEEADRQAYLESVRSALRVGGHLILATFALNGPERCSGLPVRRYDPDSMGEFLGPDFELVESLEREHVTPGGSSQLFIYAVFRRVR
jgi:SAM-dependent methyltransferase